VVVGITGDGWGMDGGWIGKFLDSFFGDGEVEMRLRKMWPIFE
jgi:hypothetical protein